MSFKGLMTGVSGLAAQAKKMEVIGNNLANISTTGFKKSTVNFQEAFYDVIRQASGGQGGVIGGTNSMEIGTGVKLGSINSHFSQGNRIDTGRTLDFMIEGEDFFVSENGTDGSLILSRNGNFELDGNGFLVDSIGNGVQGFNVNPETQVVTNSAQDIFIDQRSINPQATSAVDYQANIDSSSVEQSANNSTLGWELFSGGENFGSFRIATPGGSGSRNAFGSGFYQDNADYTDTAAAVNVALDTITLQATPVTKAEGYSVGDTVTVLQGTTQVQRTVSAVNTGTRAITLSSALPGTFNSGATLQIGNLSNATTTRGSSGALMHNDVQRSQIAMVDQDGKLIASFHRVGNDPAKYTRGTATVSGGASTVSYGTGEFTSIQELKELMELALRDSQLTNYASSTDLSVELDKFGKISFGGTGLAQSFRLVMNADNTEMLDRFNGIAMTDAASVATTQARVDSSGEVIAPPALALGNRTVNASKWWFNSSGIENYGFSSTSSSTEYGEYAGMRLDGGADGSGYGLVQLSLTDALGQSKSKEFRMVAREPDTNQGEFTTMGELALLLQNSLRSDDFSSVAVDGVLVADQTASVNFTGGRLNVNTTSGLFRGLTISAVNDSTNNADGITRTDDMNFGSVLGHLSDGVNGKSASSNQFIQADISSQTRVFDSQGNEHTTQTYFVRDRSSGLNNIEWKFKTALNPNLNTFASEESEDNGIYSNTYNSMEDAPSARGVLAFDIESGKVLGEGSAGSDSRYRSEATLNFLAQNNSQEADDSEIAIDFEGLTSFNGQNTIIGHNVDGFAMGNLIRIASEANTGNINGIYSNGKIRNLAKIGLMSIANPEGLQKVGSSYFMQTPNSSQDGLSKGIDQIFAVGSVSNQSSDSVTSKVHGNALEASNVDLTDELTAMITTQRSYSAGGKIITSSDEMLQEALNLKR